jgi:hypothetical protein
VTRDGAVLILVAVLGATPVAAGERREVGAHEHGRSVLDIAVEGGRVAMELTAPGADIVGFEHPAGTEEERAAVGDAKAALADPLAVFVLPRAAGCRVTDSKVEIASEDQRDGQADERAGHAEFRAEYALECAAPSALSSFTPAFFDRFPMVQRIGVTLLTERGQTAFEVQRGAVRVALEGLP